MHGEDIEHTSAGDAPVAAGPNGEARAWISRRQAIGRLSTGAAVGAAAWMVPEILTARPAAGATLSGTPTPFGFPPPGGSTTPAATDPANDPTSVSTDPAANDPTSVSTGVTTAMAGTGHTSPSSSLALTGVDLQRDVEVGAALVAGGWALQHWASRTPRARPARAGQVRGPEAGSRGNAV